MTQSKTSLFMLQLAPTAVKNDSCGRRRSMRRVALVPETTTLQFLLLSQNNNNHVI